MDAGPPTFVAVIVIASLSALFASTANEPAHTLPPQMLAAGAAVLAQADPKTLQDPGVAAALAGQMHEAMSALAWQPGETAPKDRVILLGLQRDEEFINAIGYWEVHDEPPFDGGRWTTTVWWGALPTHWAEIPPPPKR